MARILRRTGRSLTSAYAVPVLDQEATATGTDPDRRRAWVEQIMGMPISVHVRGAGARGPAAAEAVAKLFADLREVVRILSIYRPDSEISRLARGGLDLDRCDPAVREVHRLCGVARTRTEGYVDAWAVPGRLGQFDPTVLVKSWAVARAARHFETVPALALAVRAGGDILVRPGDEPDPWIIGIQHPHERGATIARVPVHDGGVATSGLAARGAHIFDPHTGAAVTGVLSATVVGPSLMWADVWAGADLSGDLWPARLLREDAEVIVAAHSAYFEVFAMAADVDAVIAVGLNCTDPAGAAAAVRVAARASGKPVVVYPNSGGTWLAAERRWVGARQFSAEVVEEWVDLGARLVGGCCPVGHGEIAQIAVALDRMGGRAPSWP